MIQPPIVTPIRTVSAPASLEKNPLREKAAELETAFLSEMLGYAGLGEARESFGGGIGEEQFSSFLRKEQAEAMVKAGGIGLTEVLFRAMSAHVASKGDAND